MKAAAAMAASLTVGDLAALLNSRRDEAAAAAQEAAQTAAGAETIPSIGTWREENPGASVGFLSSLCFFAFVAFNAAKIQRREWGCPSFSLSLSDYRHPPRNVWRCCRNDEVM